MYIHIYRCIYIFKYIYIYIYIYILGDTREHALSDPDVYMVFRGPIRVGEPLVRQIPRRQCSRAMHCEIQGTCMEDAARSNLGCLLVGYSGFTFWVSIVFNSMVAKRFNFQKGSEVSPVQLPILWVHNVLCIATVLDTSKDAARSNDFPQRCTAAVFEASAAVFPTREVQAQRPASELQESSCPYNQNIGYIRNILGFFQESCSIYPRMAVGVGIKTHPR